jgi:hypothetical protein
MIMAETPAQNSEIIFPHSAIVGSIGDLARVLADGSEVCEEFFFMGGLTVFGAIVSRNLSLNVRMPVSPRLFTTLIGDSYGAKKSTAMKSTVGEFEKILDRLSVNNLRILYGVGSSEGLMRELTSRPNVLLAYDELKGFVDKSKVQNSCLLPMVTSLFEGENWDNVTRRSKQSLSIRGAHLSLIGCCTLDTYAEMWTPESIAIGLPNRLFVVKGSRKQKVALPKPPDDQALCEIRKKIIYQIEKFDLDTDEQIKLEFTDEAKEYWTFWYENLPESEHVRRLDTIGLRLLALIAFTTDKTCVDLETAEIVKSILDYEFAIRKLTDPINADNIIARLEESIRRVLGACGPHKERELRRKVHADRSGMWAFQKAIQNLRKANDISIQRVGKTWIYELNAQASD